MQEGVAMFATELLRLKAQIICGKFQPETILAYAAAQQMSPEDQQLIPQAMELLKSEPLRAFRIEVASDSLVKLDEQQNKQERMEFIGAFSNFLREAVTAGQQVPELTPLIMQVLKFGVAGFKAGRQIEGTIDVAMQQLVQNQAQAKANPQPDPEAAKMQMEQQAAQTELQAKMQMEQAKGQADMQIEQMKAQMTAQLEQSRQQHEAQLKMQELATKEQFDRWKADLDAATKIMVARISSNPGADIPLLEVQQAAADTLTNDLGDSVRNAMGQMAEAHNNMANMHGESMQKLHETLQALSAPKRIVRGPDGRAAGVEVVPPESMQ